MKNTNFNSRIHHFIPLKWLGCNARVKLRNSSQIPEVNFSLYTSWEELNSRIGDEFLNWYLQSEKLTSRDEDELQPNLEGSSSIVSPILEVNSSLYSCYMMNSRIEVRKWKNVMHNISTFYRETIVVLKHYLPRWSNVFQSSWQALHWQWKWNDCHNHFLLSSGLISL